jgi:guanylate kinase
MNQLHHIAEFRSALSNYQLSSSAKQTLAQTRLVLLVGPTSSGRNTVINKLLGNGDYHYIVSDTTRERRMKDGVPIETDGREYWFRSEDDVLAELKRGEFLEAAIIHEQQVSGISIREIEKAHKAGSIAITDIEPTGARTIHEIKPDATIIFVVPPDFEAWIARLHRRSDLPEDEIRRRLKTACDEITAALECGHYIFVINDKLEDTVAEVDAIARQGAQGPEKQQYARQVALRLHDTTKEYLEQPQQGD